jgi:hypothetical protein
VSISSSFTSPIRGIDHRYHRRRAPMHSLNANVAVSTATTMSHAASPIPTCRAAQFTRAITGRRLRDGLEDGDERRGRSARRVVRLPLSQVRA